MTNTNCIYHRKEKTFHSYRFAQQVGIRHSHALSNRKDKKKWETRFIQELALCVRYTQDQTCIGRYTLAVDRRFKKEGEQTADFIPCVAFGKSGEFAEKYFRKGTKIAVTGRIQTGSYTNRDGQKVYTTDIIVEEQEFAESKGSSQQAAPQQTAPRRAAQKQDESLDGFMSIPDGIEEELPFE